MPAIKPRTTQKNFVRHITRLYRETNETLFASAAFIGESTDIPRRGLHTGVMILGAVGTGKTSACMYPCRSALQPVITDRVVTLEDLLNAKLRAPDLERRNLELQLAEREALAEVDEARELDRAALRAQVDDRLKPLVSQLAALLSQAAKVNRAIAQLESESHACAGGYVDPANGGPVKNRNRRAAVPHAGRS